MSILIKGMEMPANCDICPFMKTNDDLSVEDYRYMYCDFPGIGDFVTDYEATRHPDCPLVPVPVHGDLIDQDAYRDEFMDGVYALCNDDPDNCRANAIIDLFDLAPTIIPAEPPKEDDHVADVGKKEVKA